MAETVGSTSGFVSQVLHPLVRQGWVRSGPIRVRLAGIRWRLT